jgi:hypothetical protein
MPTIYNYDLCDPIFVNKSANLIAKLNQILASEVLIKPQNCYNIDDIRKDCARLKKKFKVAEIVIEKQYKEMSSF